MQTILYLHGFKSSGQANKAEVLKRKFENVISPTLPISPKESIKFISDIISKNKIDLIIGSSLGGFYSYIIHKKFKTKALLINPSLTPWERLKNQTGEQFRFVTNEKFEWTETHVKELIELNSETLALPHYENILNFFLAKDDELLNHSKIPENFKNSNITFFDKAGHIFTAFTRTIPQIKTILEKQIPR